VSKSIPNPFWFNGSPLASFSTLVPRIPTFPAKTRSEIRGSSDFRGEGEEKGREKGEREGDKSEGEEARR